MEEILNAIYRHPFAFVAFSVVCLSAIGIICSVFDKIDS